MARIEMRLMGNSAEDVRYEKLHFLFGLTSEEVVVVRGICTWIIAEVSVVIFRLFLRPQFDVDDQIRCI